MQDNNKVYHDDKKTNLKIKKEFLMKFFVFVLAPMQNKIEELKYQTSKHIYKNDIVHHYRKRMFF